MATDFISRLNFQVLFFKPIMSVLAMFKFLSDFKTSYLQILRLEYCPKSDNDHYERMFTVDYDDANGTAEAI